MNSITLIYCLVFLIAVVSMMSIAQNNNVANITPFTHFGHNTLESFSGSNSIWLATAIASTYFIVQSDVDYRVHDFFARNIETYDPYTTVALWGGYVAPLVVSGGIYLWGKQTDNQELYTAGCAALQAAGIAQLTVTVLKVFTGRPHPDPLVYSDMKEASRIFNFGFLRGGLHYGWPSGHLAVNSAVITSLMTMYHRNIAVQIVGGLSMAYLIFGVSAHEGATMHWFSDVVAGTIFGCIIGVTVGKDFREQWEDSITRASDAHLNIMPTLSSRFTGIQINIPI